MPQQIVIVGGGLVGCLAGAYLARRGFRVDIYERRPDYRQKGILWEGHSRNLSISPRGMRALTAIGIAEKVRDFGIPMGNRVIHAPHGKLFVMPYGQPEWVNLSVPRNDLNQLLLETALEHGVNFHFEKSCMDVNARDKKVVFREPDGALLQVSADLIIGADGAFSKVRTALIRTHFFNYSQEYFTSAYKELTIKPESEASLERSAIHIWARRGYTMVALPNLDGTFRASLLLPLQGEVSHESIRTPEQIERFLKYSFPDVYHCFPNPIDEFLHNPVGLIMSVRCGRYHHRDSVLIMGDAAHALVPFLGQGVNVGFEDCYELDRLFGEHGSDVASVLPRFSELRQPNGVAAADISMWNHGELTGNEASADAVMEKMRRNEEFRTSGKALPAVVVMVNFLDMSYAEIWRQVQEHSRAT